MKMLGGLSAQAFLDRYWQKAPWLVRQAFPDLGSLISGDELAGLATEQDVESRLVTSGDWKLRHGPFSEDDFTKLPEKDWTLLVQAVDHWVPEVARLFEHFHFLPAWRLDDVMISYAAPGGGVGPHFDQYDVFLIQAEGQREWRIGQSCDENDECRSDTELKILTDFSEQERWVLNPGDMLYVPPGVAHWGEAITEGITYSIGFRAPSQAEALVDFAQFVAERGNEFERYSDQNLTARKDPFRLAPEDIDRIQALLTTITQDRALITEWFGRYMTEPKYEPIPGEEHLLNAETIAHHLQRQPLLRNDSARLAYVPGCLFVEGEEVRSKLPNEGLRWFCEQKSIAAGDLGDDLSSEPWTVLTDLVNRDVFYFDAV